MSVFEWFSSTEGGHQHGHSQHLFLLHVWLAQKLTCRLEANFGQMSESDPEAPWTIGPDAAGGPAGPPPPQPVESWRRLSQAFSGAILQVLDSRYATTFTGSILTYLPQELLRPYHGLTRLVVSIRPMRPRVQSSSYSRGRGAGGDDEWGGRGTRGAQRIDRGEWTQAARHATTCTSPCRGDGVYYVTCGDSTGHSHHRYYYPDGSRRQDQDDSDRRAPYQRDHGAGAEETTTPRPATGDGGEEPVEDEGRSTTRATPKPRATGSRKLLCHISNISIWVHVWARLFSLTVHDRISCLGTTGDNVCSSKSEASPSIGLAAGALGKHRLGGLGCQTAWADASVVHFDQWAAATAPNPSKHSCKTVLLQRPCSTPWCSIALAFSLVMISRYRITTIRRSTWVSDLQCCQHVLMHYLQEAVNVLAGPFTYAWVFQNPEGRQSATYHTASSSSMPMSTCTVTGHTSRSRIRCSSTGPKSGHIHRTLQCTTMLRLLILLIQVSILKAVNVDVRVGGPAAIPPGASSGAKHGGIREASAPTIERADPTRIAKRTYSRAYARAARQGGSYYQGRWRDFKWYQKAHIKPIYVPRTRQTPKSEGHYIRVCTWNAGGLTRPTFQEIETWVRDQAIDVMFIQETKWAEEYCWNNKDYNYIHSAGTQKVDKVGGVLTIISSKLAKSSDVQFQSIWAGRILHVRVPAGGSLIDLLNVYQYSVNEKPETLHRRQQLLQRLHKCLAGLPRRHSLIMSGDMNTSCAPTEHVCGSHVLPVGEYHKQDYHDFLHLCEALSLTLLNTWTKPDKGQLETFRFGSLSSQIDYIIVRRSQATPIARQAKVLAEFPVAGWREGAKHYPVLALVPIQKPRWHAAQSSHFKQLNLAAVLEDLRQAQPPTRLQAFQLEVDTKIQKSENFDQTVLQAVLRHYPPPARPATPPTQPVELANSARHMWQLFRQMRSHRFTMQGVVQAWKLWVRFSRAHAIHKQRANARVKARRDDLLQQAQQAAATGNMCEIWGVVKRLAPKTRYKKVQRCTSMALSWLRRQSWSG